MDAAKLKKRTKAPKNWASSKKQS